MNAQGLADYALNDTAIWKDHLAMLRSVWRSNLRRGGASRDRLIYGCVHAIEQAARVVTFRQANICHWSVVFPDQVRADAAILLADKCIAEWSAVS